MNFEQLKMVNENIKLNEYLSLYKYVTDNMSHPEWLGTFNYDEIKSMLLNGGKIWMFYDNDIPVCSLFSIPNNVNSLQKHNVNYDEKEIVTLGPIMVSPDYVGNGFQCKMMKIFEDYCVSIGKKYIYTKTHADNIYSINNIKALNYMIVDEYESERGKMKAFIKSFKGR